MSIEYALVNKRVLALLRQKTQVSFEYLEKTTGKSRDILLEWEDIDNSKRPTINQAKILAKGCHVPFACLYMRPEDVGICSIPNLKNLRTMKNAIQQDDSLLNLSIVDIIEARRFLIETKEDLEESIPVFSLKINGDSVSQWADKIRKYFSLDLSKQYKSMSTRQFFIYLKRAIEDKGIFIHGLSGVPLESARGIAIYNEILPIIGINNEDHYPAKAFSIIHELVHIIKRASVMCNDMYSSFSVLKEEIFCNAVAGEVLVPEVALKIVMENYSHISLSVDVIEKVARHFSVSKEVIIRRLLDVSPPYIDKVKYLAFAEEFAQMYEHNKELAKQARKEGRASNIFISPNRDAIDKNSTSLSKCFLHGFGEGLFDKQDISRYLGLSPRHVDKYLWEVSTWDK